MIDGIWAHRKMILWALTSSDNPFSPEMRVFPHMYIYVEATEYGPDKKYMYIIYSSKQFAIDHSDRQIK